MEIWIPITIAAAFMQNLRFMLQKHLKETRLSTAGATFSRFIFAAPLAALFLTTLLQTTQSSLPEISPRFVLFASIGGLGQISATLFVVALFAERNFAVGITFKKTETMQTAMLSLLILGEAISSMGLVAIIIGLIGVIVLADPPKGGKDLSWRQRLFNKASGYGLASGALFGVSAVGYRGASLALGDSDFLLRAAVTLAFVTLFQTVVMAIYLWLREAGEIGRVLKSWRVSGLVGVTGMLGSLGWFTAFTLQNAAYVKALGQVELIFTFLASYFIFKERSTKRELTGIALVLLSIGILVLTL